MAPGDLLLEGLSASVHRQRPLRRLRLHAPGLAIDGLGGGRGLGAVAGGQGIAARRGLLELPWFP